MYLLFIWRWTYWFWWGKIHFEGHWNGWALKIETFWALKWQRAYISSVAGVSFVAGVSALVYVLLVTDVHAVPCAHVRKHPRYCRIPSVAGVPVPLENTPCPISLVLLTKAFYVPETHIMYFIRPCRFLKCSEEIHYVPIGDGWEQVLVRNVLHYIPVLLSNHHL